jgi:hypothetical protein
VFLQNNSYLKRLYNEYNKKYFYGKLPNIVVGYVTTRQLKRDRVQKGTCAFTSFDPKVRTMPIAIGIHFDRSKSMTYIKADLLHEMAHVANPRANHGLVFQKEMKRIAQAGAFVGVW